jgi:hypothetical protein
MTAPALQLLVDRGQHEATRRYFLSRYKRSR